MLTLLAEQKGKAEVKSSSPLICTNTLKAVDMFGLESKSTACWSYTSGISNDTVSVDSINSESSPNGELAVN